MHRTHRALSIAGAVALTATTAACVGSTVPTDGDLRFDGTRLVDAQQSLAGFESTWRGAIANSGRAATFALDSGCFLQVDDAGEVANRILCGPVRVAGDIETSWQSHPVDAVPGSGGGVRLVLARAGSGSATATSTTTSTSTSTTTTTTTTTRSRATDGGSDFQPHAQPDPELRTVRADGTPAFFGDTLPAPRGEDGATAAARPSGTRSTTPSSSAPTTSRATGTPSPSRTTTAPPTTPTTTRPPVRPSTTTPRPTSSAPAPTATTSRPTPSASPTVADAPDDGLATSAAGECPAVTAPSGTASGWRQAFTCTTTLTRTTSLPPAGEASNRRVEGRAAAGRTWVTAVITPTELTTYRTGGSNPREATYDISYFSFGTKLTVAGTTYLPRQLVVEQAFEGRPPTITAWFEVPTGEARMSLTGWVSTRLERTTTEASDARSEGAFTYAIDQRVVFGRR